jgi:CubicO group peptidase (beta-lactamase class C family)
MHFIILANTLVALTIGMSDPNTVSADEPRPSSRPAPDNVDTFLERQMRRRDIPGLQLAVVRHRKIIKLGAYGLANVQDPIPVDNRTVFPINSITKAFVGVALMQLVEAGKLDLSASAGHYLDGLPSAWQPVTLWQLLSHTSGIPDIWDENARLIAKDPDMALARARTLPMEFARGERFKYNQTNYLLLGQIIDKVSGQPFTRFIQERQLDVANMPRSGFHDSRDVVAHSARVYSHFEIVGGKRERGDQLLNTFEEFPPFLRAAAGINTTAEELARWIIALQQGRLLKSEKSVTALWTPISEVPGGAINGYGIGWPTITRSEHRAAAATGGMRAALFIYPDDDLAIAILTNLAGASPQVFVDDVAGYYIPSMDSSTGFGLPPAIQALRAELLKRGFEHALEIAREQGEKNARLKLTEDEINEWSYRLLDHGQTKESIEILKMNVSLYPKSANTHDSLAEALEAAGDRESAIKNYRRSLELNPKNRNAVEHLRTLDPRGAKPGSKRP